MKKKINSAFLLKPFAVMLAFFLLSHKAEAKHIVGGEIYYQYLGTNHYRIFLKVYRDCLSDTSGGAQFDNPGVLGVFNTAADTLIGIYNLTLGTPTKVPANLNASCSIVPTSFCVIEAIYVTVVSLPPVPGGYTLAYQRCCRNGNLINIQDPLSLGTTYFQNIPDTTITYGNSSPYFNSYPPIAICAGVPFEFDHSATDNDGDSLIYEFCDTYVGATIADPQPTVPSDPPYTPVPWAPGFSGGYPITSSPMMTIDSHTGRITGTPTAIGRYVVGVCVSEYKKGTTTLIGMHHRDFQFNIFESASGIQTISKEDATTIKIFPDPVTSPVFNVTFTAIENENVTVQITDVLGKKYYSRTTTVSSLNTVMTVQCPEKLASGIYFLSVLDKANRFFNKKFVVQ